MKFLYLQLLKRLPFQSKSAERTFHLVAILYLACLKVHRWKVKSKRKHLFFFTEPNLPQQPLRVESRRRLSTTQDPCETGGGKNTFNLQKVIYIVNHFPSDLSRGGGGRRKGGGVASWKWDFLALCLRTCCPEPPGSM